MVMIESLNSCYGSFLLKLNVIMIENNMAKLVDVERIGKKIE